MTTARGQRDQAMAELVALKPFADSHVDLIAKYRKLRTKYRQCWRPDSRAFVLTSLRDVEKELAQAYFVWKQAQA